MPNAEEAAALQINNNCRAGKGLGPLQWDDGLWRDAQNYAEQIASQKRFQHSGVSGQGENLFWASNNADKSAAVNCWLGEEKNYHGESIADGDFGSYGHYTQCMWRSTTHVGIGKAQANDGSTYIVGRYTPQGNWMGQKPY